MTLPDSAPPSTRPVSATATSPADRAALEAARERAIRLLTDRFADDTLTVDEIPEDDEPLRAPTFLAAGD